MTKKRKQTKLEKNMNEKKNTPNVKDYVNNAHQTIKEHQKNIYPKDIRGLFERLGIE